MDRPVPATAAPTSDEILRDDDLAEVLRQLLKAKNKAYELGLELKLPQYEVESIRDTYQDPQERLTRVIEKFLKQACPEPTWRVIVRALKSPLVNNAQLAKEIETAHFADSIITREASADGPVSAEIEKTTKRSGSPVPYPMTVEYVEKKIKQFERRFNKTLKWATRDCLKKRGVSVEKVVDALADLPADDVPEHKQFLESQLNILYQASDLTELFGSLNYNMNYLSYHLVEHLIREFDLVIRSEMEAYKEDLRQFREKTPLKLFHKTQKKRHVDPPSKFDKIVAKFEWPEDRNDITLEDVEKFRQEYAYSYGLHDCAMMLSEIFPNCFIVTWLVPGSIVTKLKRNVPTNMLRKHFVSEFTVAGECVAYFSAHKMPTNLPQNLSLPEEDGVRQMSDDLEMHSLDNILLVTSIAKLLSAEEIYHIAEVWLQGKTDISIYNPTNDNELFGLKLLMTLKNMGMFSCTKLQGLLDIMRCINRYDLIEKVESFIKERGESLGEMYTKEKKASQGERQQLHEIMLMRSMELEPQIMELREPDLVVDKGLRVVQKAKAVTQSLTTDLSRDRTSLARHLSVTSPISRSKLRPVLSMPLLQHSGNRPIPKPKPATLDRGAAPHIPKSKKLLKESAAYGGPHLTTEKAATEEDDDRTGDSGTGDSGMGTGSSGMGTGSGSIRVEDRKHDDRKIFYTTLSERTKETDNTYQEMRF